MHKEKRRHCCEGEKKDNRLKRCECQTIDFRIGLGTLSGLIPTRLHPTLWVCTSAHEENLHGNLAARTLL